MAPSSDITEFRKVLESSKNIMVLSGAGLSAPSGLYMCPYDMKSYFSPSFLFFRDCDISWNFRIPVVRSSK